MRKKSRAIKPDEDNPFFRNHHFFPLYSIRFDYHNEKSSNKQKRTYRTKSALSVSMHEMYEGRRTFFVSSPHIKKHSPSKKME